MEQLSDAEGSYVRGLGNPFAELGKRVGIICSDKDRVIAQDSFGLGGDEVRVDVDIHHGVMPWVREAVDLVESWLLAGSFEGRVAGEVPAARPDF